MSAQLRPTEETAQEQQTAPAPLGRRTHPHAKATQKKRGPAKKSSATAVCMKWVASGVGLVATMAATYVAIKPIFVLPKAKPAIVVDERASMRRNSKNNQIELRVNLTLLNKGEKMALIPRPTVSLYVDTPDRLLEIPADDLHFEYEDGPGEVIFPVSLHEGAATYEKQIVCSIGRNGDWYQPGLLHLNLVFPLDGNELVNHCLVFSSPVPESIRELPPDRSKCIPISNCGDFGEGFTKRTS